MTPDAHLLETYPNVLPIEAHSLMDLNWQALGDALVAECKTAGGQVCWQTQPFLAHSDDIQTHLAQVDALTQMRQRDGLPILDLPVIPDDAHGLDRSKRGITLSPTELGQLGQHLHVQRQLFGWFKQGFQHIHRPACLAPFFEVMVFPIEVYEPLSNLFTPEGHVADGASDELYRLRQRLMHLKQRISEQMTSVMQRQAKYLQDHIMTERDGRAVLSVQVAFKALVKGIIHDVSSSGATVFIEPQSVVSLNNDRRITEKAIDDEIVKICQKYSAYVGEHADDLSRFYDDLTQLDRRLSGAELALKLDLMLQDTDAQPALTLNAVCHPLLLLQTETASRKAIIPNTMMLSATATDESPQGLLITGPNTGGKTVLLKTLGLCAWMHRAGLPLPTKKESTMGFFQPILTDIGDHQDLSQGLSSFSGHLNRVKPWLQPSVNLNKALVLMDEVGTGTDPQEGSALAQAVIAYLAKHHATLAITTHLEGLKHLALDDARFWNARVTFDLDNLRPTYQLVLGTPGTSHALHIAEQLGIPRSIIDEATSTLSQQDRQASDLLGSLEATHHTYTKTEQELTEREKELAQLAERIQQQERTLNEKKDYFHQTTQAQVRERVYDMDRYIKRLKRQLKQHEEEAKLDDAHLNRAERGLAKRSGKINETLATDQAPEVTVDDIELGQRVQSKQLQCQGNIIKIKAKKKTLTLDNNGIPVTLPFSDIRLLHIPASKHLKAAPKRKKTPTSPSQQRGLRSMSSGAADVSKKAPIGLPTQSIKLLGQRVDDALAELERFIDGALRQNHQIVAVIHGHGTGALKKAVRQYLKQAKGLSVKHFEPAPPESGGDGQTLVVLM